MLENRNRARRHSRISRQPAVVSGSATLLPTHACLTTAVVPVAASGAFAHARTGRATGRAGSFVVGVMDAITVTLVSISSARSWNSGRRARTVERQSRIR